MRIQTLGEYVLVRLSKREETKSGLVLPEIASLAVQEGEALSIGPLAAGIVLGDKVIFAKHAGTEISFEGERLWILPAKEILGVYKDGTNN